MMDLQASLGGPGIGNGIGQCPLTPQGDCSYGGDTVSCTLIRECDNYFGTNHFEYFQGGGPSGNVNIWQFDPASGKKVWIGQSGKPETPPSGASAPVVDLSTGAYTQYNATQVAKISGVLGVPAGTPLQYNPYAGYVLTGAGGTGEPATKSPGLTGGIPAGGTGGSPSGAVTGNVPGKPPVQVQQTKQEMTPWLLLAAVGLIWYLS